MVTYSWGTGCGDVFFNQCVKTEQWSIEDKTVLIIKMKDDKIKKYKFLRLDDTTLIIMKQ